MYVSVVLSHTLTTCDAFSPVYRVNWLRAKARKERWEEEIDLVENEMEWTTRCFHYHEERWRQRALNAKGPGERAYAWKQNSTWGEWVATANDTFTVT